MVFRSKWQAFKLATLSGFAEPLGVIIVGRPTSFLCVCETFVLLENKIGKTNLLCFMFEGAGWILTISGAEKAWFLVDSSGFNQNRVAPRTLNFWLIFFVCFHHYFLQQRIYFQAAWVLKFLKVFLDQVCVIYWFFRTFHIGREDSGCQTFWILTNIFVTSAVGGVMAFLTLHEMLPLAFDYAGQKQAIKAVFLGMAFMSAR